ncbi:hypothetical protein [Glycomyces sp. NPDC047010]|uniref:hypothetical protein n=1 Tax=Glycomyces sp. NPDC047010 TaxID=3155023 RepID=UPI0033D401FE
MATAIPVKPVFTVGERVSASKMNTLASHADWATDPPMVHLYPGANVTWASANNVTWTQNLSSLSNATVTLPAERITVPYTGIWEWTFQVGTSADPASGNPVRANLYTGTTDSTGTRIAGQHGLRYSGITNYVQCTARVSMIAGTTWVRATIASSTVGVTVYGSARETWLEGTLIARQ